MARAAGRLAEPVEVAVVALQWHLAARDVLTFLRMRELGRSPVLDGVAGVAQREAVVVIAVTIDAAVGLHRHTLGVACLAGDLPMLAGQRPAQNLG